MTALLEAFKSVDVSVYHFLNGYAGHRLLDHFAGFEETNQLFKGGLFLTAYVYLWFRMGPDQRKRRRMIVAVLAGTLLALALCRIVADVAPFRARPMYNASIYHHPYSFPIRPDMEDWSSFPSDHAAYFFALAFGLAYLLRRSIAVVPIMLYTILWICLPRMFLGLHYLSDIVVGGALGIATVWLAVRSEWLSRGVADRVLAFAGEKPQIFYPGAFLVCFEMSVLFDDLRHVAGSLLSAGLVTPHLLRSALAAAAFLGFAAVAAYGMLLALHWYLVHHDARASCVTAMGEHDPSRLLH
jgi:membrane-associated phospholipid phosphatase